jgi:hypothetical protein
MPTWFVPPVVIPALIAILVLGSLIYQAMI